MTKKSHSKIKVICSVLGGLLVFTAIVILISWMPRKEVDSIQKTFLEEEQLGVKEKIELVDRYRGTLISGFSAFATTLGGIVLFLNYRLGVTKSAAEKRLSESRLTAEQFTKAADLLINKNVYIRLCGIYSLEKLANDFPKAHFWSVMSILTAFVQKESSSDFLEEIRRRKDAEDEHGYFEERPLHLKIAVDVQAVLSAIGRMNKYRKNREDESFIDRRLVDLSKTNLQQANMRNTDLRGVDIAKAYLKFADLSESNLEGTNLGASCLERVDLSGANLSKSNLKGACLDGANLCRSDLRGSDLRRANLSRANMRKADLSGLDTKLEEAEIIRADLSGADLSGADLSGADLSGTYLTNANLKQTNLKHTKGLVEAQVSRCLLCHTYLPEKWTLDPNRDCKEL